MAKSLSQRTACNSRLMLDLIDAAHNLDKAIRGEKADFNQVEHIASLFDETYSSITRKKSMLEVDTTSEWNSAIINRLIPDIYGIQKSMPYSKEHVEAGLYFIVEQLNLAKQEEPLSMKFARNVLVRLSQDLLQERSVSWRTASKESPYKRRAA